MSILWEYFIINIKHYNTMTTSVKFLFGAILAMGASVVLAQTPEQLEQQCANGNTVGENNSLYVEYAKQKNWRDAYEFWKALYDQVPNFNKNVYIYGANILKFRINEAKADPEARKKAVEDLMTLYDNRMKYFGDDAKQPKHVILGTKAVDYLTIMGKNADEERAFPWVEEATLALKEDADSKVLTQYVNLSFNKFRRTPDFKAMYIANYMKGTEFLDGALDRYQLRLEEDLAIVAGEKEGDVAKAAKDTTLAKQFIDFTRKAKLGLVNQFANSGAADVATLVEIFTPQVEDKKDDQAFLNNVSKLLGRSSEGRETELYTTCADYSYQISPSMEAAKGLAKAALKKQDWDRAMDYYDEALKLAIQPDDKTEILMYEAAIHQERGRKSAARDCLRKSLAIDPDQSQPHVMIANLYATSARESGLDSNVQGLVYVAAVNEMQQAVAHESDDAKRAQYNSAIAKYKAGYPEKSTLFMKGMQSGSSVTIGGWMGVTVTVP